MGKEITDESKLVLDSGLALQRLHVGGGWAPTDRAAAGFAAGRGVVHTSLRQPARQEPGGKMAEKSNAAGHGGVSGAQVQRRGRRRRSGRGLLDPGDRA